MELTNIVFTFKHQVKKPVNPVEGSFYWVTNSDDSVQIWFAPDTNAEHLVLLNKDFTDSITSLQNRLSKVETGVKNTKGIKSYSLNSDGNYAVTLTDGSSIVIKNGYTPSITVGDNGDWFVDGTDTNCLAMGIPGDDGKNGTDGKDGADGKSAYDIAVANGFSGTEKEWVSSLKGKDGTIGENGKDGQNGKDGESAYDIAVRLGLTTLSEEEWIKSLKGEDGVIGKDGQNGSDGKDGKSAYEIYLDTVSESETPMTQDEWLESLKGEQAELTDSDIDEIVEKVKTETTVKLSWKEIS